MTHSSLVPRYRSRVAMLAAITVCGWSTALRAASETPPGAAELTGRFADPEFDAGQRAFYYVRLLEIPTPRWTLYDQVRYGDEMAPDVPLVHQERAFTSPIWYEP